VIKKPLIIDGDPGQDDVMAVLLAAGCGAFDIKGVTCVAGNCSVDNGVNNMLKVVDYLGLDIPIIRGAATPLRGEPHPAKGAHGAKGNNGPILPPAKSKALDVKAVDFIADVLKASDEPMTIVPLGPLTNIAEFMMCYPDLICKIERLVLMGGGALSYGNMTPTAEYNFWHDPEAARIVFRSGVPITMAGLDVTEKALVTPEDSARFRAIGNKAGIMAADMMDFYSARAIRTGWAGGSAADGASRMKLAYTRAMVSAALNGELDNVEFKHHDVFNVDYPVTCPGVPDEKLDARGMWADKEAYDKQANKLAGMFAKNFAEKYPYMDPEIVAAGPQPK